MSLANILTPIYYSADAGLLSANKFYQYLKDNEINNTNGKRITLREVTNFINEQAVAQSFSYQPQQRKYQYPLISNFPWQKIMIDLADVRNENMKANDNTAYLFCAIDVFTRYAMVFPMKSKTEEECLRCLNLMMSEIVEINQGPLMPSSTQVISDNESALTGALCQHWFQENAITSTLVKHDVKKKSIVERFIRTLRGLIRKYEYGFNSTRYIDQLPALVSKYNNTVHSALGTTPIKAFQDNTKYEKNVKKRIFKIDCIRNPSSECNEKFGFSYHKYNPIPSLRTDKFTNLKVGDRVRLLRKKPLTQEAANIRYRLEKRKWEKEDYNWSKTIHTIEAIQNYQYKVTDRASWYRPSELQLVKQVNRIPADIEEKYKQPREEELPDIESKYNDNSDLFEPAPARQRANDLRLLQNELKQNDEEYKENLNNAPARRSQRGLQSNQNIYLESEGRYFSPDQYAQYINARYNQHRGRGIKTKKMTLKQLRALFNPY